MFNNIFKSKKRKKNYEVFDCDYVDYLRDSNLSDPRLDGSLNIYTYDSGSCSSSESGNSLSSSYFEEEEKFISDKTVDTMADMIEDIWRLNE